MRHEIDPTVLNWLDEQRLSYGSSSLTSLLEKLGVGVLNEKDTLYAWAWRRRAVPEHVVTVWSEDIVIGQGGVWETDVVLEALGSKNYTPDQVLRESERISILGELMRDEKECKVILLINRRSREEEAKGVSAVAEFRTIDPELWHIESCENSHAIKLRRGQRPIEMDESGRAGPRANDEPDVTLPLRFQDQEMRDRVEMAAICHAKEVYAEFGAVTSVESENLGYDLAVTDVSSGELILKIEVKGTSGNEENFYLTRNEHREGNEDPRRWRLAVVVDALNEPALQEYRIDEMLSLFQLQPLVWQCHRKCPND